MPPHGVPHVVESPYIDDAKIRKKSDQDVHAETNVMIEHISKHIQTLASDPDFPQSSKAYKEEMTHYLRINLSLSVRRSELFKKFDLPDNAVPLLLQKWKTLREMVKTMSLAHERLLTQFEEAGGFMMSRDSPATAIHTTPDEQRQHDESLYRSTLQFERSRFEREDSRLNDRRRFDATIIANLRGREASRLADQLQHDMEVSRLAEQSRLADEVSRLAEQSRLDGEVLQLTEQHRLVEETARLAQQHRIAEQLRLSEETVQIAEQLRLSEETARIAEQLRLVEETALLAEQHRLAYEEEQNAVHRQQGSTVQAKCELAGYYDMMGVEDKTSSRSTRQSSAAARTLECTGTATCKLRMVAHDMSLNVCKNCQARKTTG